MVNRTLRQTDARAVRPYEVGTANFDTPSKRRSKHEHRTQSKTISVKFQNSFLAMSVNKVILLGNVGRDPEVRYTGPGQAIAEFPLATTERATTDATGTHIPERTEWHRIVMNGRNAEFAERYIRKGTKLYIEGKLRTRVWEDRMNIKRYVTEVYVDTFDFLGRSAASQQGQ